MKPSIQKSITSITLRSVTSMALIAGGLLSGPSAYSQEVTDVSACIGTGRAASGCQPPAVIGSSVAPATNHRFALPLSAFVGTGYVSGDTDRREKAPPLSSDAAMRLTAHCSAKIGSGQACNVADHHAESGVVVRF